MKSLNNLLSVLILTSLTALPANAGTCKIVLGELDSVHDSEISSVIRAAHGHRGHQIVQDPADADIVLSVEGSVFTVRRIFGERDQFQWHWVARNKQGDEILKLKKSQCLANVDEGCIVFDGGTHRLRKVLDKLNCN